MERIKVIYKETKVTIKTKKGNTKEFETRKGVRQNCVLSPLLFNLYTADLDKYFSKRGIGRVKLEGDRVWLLAYADDIVLMAKNKEALDDVIYFEELSKEKKIRVECRKDKDSDF